MKPKFVISMVFVVAAAALGIAFYALQKPPAPEMVAAPVVAPKTSDDDLAALKTKAEAGDPAAQTRLGKLYIEGVSVKGDLKTAAKWLQMAADQNYPDALASLGELTQAGQGVPRNLAAAVTLYRRAAESGSVAGQYDLAYLYEQGTGVKQNQSEAAKWYQRAAEGGDLLAQYDVGQRYELGVGVATNHVEAFKWLSLAAAQGQVDSTKMLPGVKGELSSDELKQAQHLVDTFQPRAPVAGK